MIANSLQCILGCNVELRITYVPQTSKKSSFNIFSCSRKIQQKSSLSNELETEIDYADYTSQNLMMKNKTLSSFSECGSRVPPRKSYDETDAVTTLRSCEGNLLSSRESLLNRSFEESIGASCSGVDSSKKEGHNGAQIVPSIHNSENQSNCFPQTLWLQKKFRSSYSSKVSFQGT